MKAPGSQKFKGIVVQDHMAWATDAIFKGGKRRIARPPSGAEILDDQNYHGGSGNMKLLYSACWYVWALLAKSENLDLHRRRCFNIMHKELEAHGQVEPLSSSHCQLWIAAVAMILWGAALEARSDLAEVCVEWFRVEFAFWRVCETPMGVWTPGGRGKLKGKPTGFNPARNEALAVIRTGQMVGKVNQYDLGPQLLSLVSPGAREAIQVWPESFPPMVGGFTARRWENGDFVCLMGDAYQDKDAVHAAGVSNGERWISIDYVPVRVPDEESVLRIDAPPAKLRGEEP